MKPKNQILEVWGELACFTRPELKVERFSYPVITPSAARGIYDAIYCKPKEFRWQITKVEILSPPRYIALRRNEVKPCGPSKITAFPKPILADEHRVQRQTMALKDVHYRIHAEIRPWPGFESQLQGLEMQFRRRAANGKCIYQPYFGCREFPAYFELIEPGAPSKEPITIGIDDLGYMVYDVYDLSAPYDPTTWKENNHNLCISLFKPVVSGGTLMVPPYSSEEVAKPERRER
jgi:CRISPR-associated protein Cas5d